MTLTFDLLHPGCCGTMGIYHNMCLLCLVKICWIVLEISELKGFLQSISNFCNLFRISATYFGTVTLIFNHMTPKVDRFTPLPHRLLVPICNEIGAFVFKLSCFTSLITTATDGRAKEGRTVNLRK